MSLPSVPFTRQQAMDLGITQHEWRTLRRDGLIRHMVGGVFVDAELDDTLDLRVRAVKLVLPRDAVVTRRTATWLHGVELLDHRGYPATPRVEVATKHQEQRSHAQLIHSHMADDLRHDDITEIGGVHVTTVLRTAADIARFLRPVDGLVVLDAFMHRGKLSKEEVEHAIPRWRRRRGVRQLERVTELADPLSESGGETHTRWRVHLMGLPRPTLQIPIVDPLGRTRFRLDLGWRHWRKALEYDGEEFHPPERAEHDRSRRDWISKRGWEIAVVRKDTVFSRGDAFEQIVSELVAGVR